MESYFGGVMLSSKNEETVFVKMNYYEANGIKSMYSLRKSHFSLFLEGAAGHEQMVSKWFDMKVLGPMLVREVYIYEHLTNKYVNTQAEQN